MTRRRRTLGHSAVSPLPPPAVSPFSSSSSSSLQSSDVARAPPGIPEFPSAATAGATSAAAASSLPAAAAASSLPAAAAASSLPAAAAAAAASSLAAAAAVGGACASRESAAAAAVFLPGDPLLPLLSLQQRGETAAAVQRLGELLQQYDAENPAALAAAAAGAAAAEVLAAAAPAAAAETLTGGFSSNSSSSAQPTATSLLPCIFTEYFPLFPYAPAYISSSTQRYEPLEGDVVLGIVNGKLAGEFYTVSLRGRADGLLPLISAFEGATKQQRPRLRCGSVVLCRVERAAAAAAELTCIDVHCKKAWHSQQKLFGELLGGILLDVPSPLALSLMAPNCFVVGALSEKVKFEMAAAANGRIWVKAHAAGDVVLIANVLLASYGKESHVIQAIVNALLSRRHQQKA